MLHWMNQNVSMLFEKTCCTYVSLTCSYDFCVNIYCVYKHCFMKLKYNPVYASFLQLCFTSLEFVYCGFKDEWFNWYLVSFQPSLRHTQGRFKVFVGPHQVWERHLHVNWISFFVKNVGGEKICGWNYLGTIEDKLVKSFPDDMRCKYCIPNIYLSILEQVLKVNVYFWNSNALKTICGQRWNRHNYSSLALLSAENHIWCDFANSKSRKVNII